MSKKLQPDRPWSGVQAYGLGYLLRKYREAAGLTQRGLQERLESLGYQVSETTLSMWENGERLPSDPVLFHHLGACLSLTHDQEVALVLACVFEMALRYLNPYMTLKSSLDHEASQLLVSLFGSLLSPGQSD